MIFPVLLLFLDPVKASKTLLQAPQQLWTYRKPAIFKRNLFSNGRKTIQLANSPSILVGKREDL